MKRYILFLILFLSSLNLKGISISATPNPGAVGQNITFEISAQFDWRVFTCPIQINFGDSSNWYEAGVCTTTPCNLTINHTYSTPGWYTATAQSNCPSTPPLPPDPAFTSVTINCPPLSITSPSSLPDGYLNQSYSFQIQKSGGFEPFTFSLIGGNLPEGISLSSDGMISGIPTTIGKYNFTVNLKDSCPTGSQNTSQNFSLNITATCNPISFTSPSNLPDGNLNQAYNYQIQTSGGWAPLTFSIKGGSLPNGLNLSSQGLISGIPTMPKIFNFLVNVKDSCPIGAQSTEKEFSIKVNCDPLNITSPSSLPSGKTNGSYSYQIQSSGGWPPVFYELSSGSMPPGLIINSNGLISGIPTLAGLFNFEVKATDSCPVQSQSVKKNFSIEIIEYELNLSVLPQSFYIPNGEATSLSITYQFNGTQNLNANLFSGEGYFYTNGELIYENNFPLNVNVQNGNAVVSEKLSIPFKVLERVLNKNTNYFIYKRTFKNNNFELEGNLNLFITTSGSSNFMIKRLELAFENGRVEETVKRNYQNLKAYALIYFVGSGILEGWWEVDGMILGRVYEILNYGENIKIETPKIPPLPTFEPGMHNLKFIITSPKVEIDFPSIFYFVNSEEEFMEFIKILKPENEKINFSDILFEWEGLKDAKYYLIEFYEKEENGSIFSAYIKESSYKLKAEIIKNYFKKDSEYYFKIYGFNEREEKIGASNFKKIIFKE